MSPENTTPDIWLVLDRSRSGVGLVPSQVVPTAQAEPAKTRWQTVCGKAAALLRDALATALWLFVCTQLFVVDVYSLIFGDGATSAHFIVTHRVIPVAIICIVVGLCFWSWKTLWMIVYIMFFPLIIVAWKVPKLFVRIRLYRNAVAVMALMNAAMLLAKNFRYHLITKSALVIAATLILLPSNASLVLLGAGLVLILLAWAMFRVILQTFRSGAFVSSQRKLISLAAKVTDLPLQLDVATLSDGTVTTLHANQLANTIQTAVITNRLLYLWAYKLQQYREASLVLVFNVLSYASLFVGSTVAFFLVNMAVLRVFPEQYAGPPHPSVVAVYLYSLSSMAFADGGGISPSGDISYGIRILAEMFGPGFLLTVVVNTLLILRGSRDDAELRETVSDLRRRAQQHEAHFQSAVRVGIDEACERLLSLGMGNLISWLGWFRQTVPSEFINGRGTPGE